jgi:hypothetical protein
VNEKGYHCTAWSELLLAKLGLKRERGRGGAEIYLFIYALDHPSSIAIDHHSKASRPPACMHSFGITNISCLARTYMLRVISYTGFSARLLRRIRSAVGQPSFCPLRPAAASLAQLALMIHRAGRLAGTPPAGH